MIIKKLDVFERTYKKLKNHIEELQRFDKVIEHIRVCENFERLRSNPISIMYGFEALKYELSGFYSFNLCKSRQGVIRLLFTVNVANNEIYLEYISMNHYKDFKNRGE